MKKYVINLKRRTDKLKKFQSTCPFKDVEVFTGFDGKKPKDQVYGQNMWNHLSKLKFLGIGQMGCFISHYTVWEKIITGKESHALIMEDDLIYGKNFLTRFKWATDNVPRDYEILYIGGKGVTVDFVTSSSKMVGVGVAQYVYPPSHADFTRGAFAYIISKSMAKLLIREADQLTKAIPLDWFLIDTFLKHRKKIFTAQPALCSSIPGNVDSDTYLRKKTVTIKR